MEKKSCHTQHVFIIGCKGIPAQYGKFETFVEKIMILPRRGFIVIGQNASYFRGGG